MAKSKAKAKSNKRKKQGEDSDEAGLEGNEYFVGMLPNATSARTRPHSQRVYREGHPSKSQFRPEKRGPLGERAFAPVSVFPAA
jgi:hypothetical protein